MWTQLPATNVERSLVSPPAEQILSGYSTWNLFDLLGVVPIVGRNFNRDDPFPVDPEAFGQPNPDLPPGTVMLSHDFWERRFGSDPTIVGKTIQIDGFGSVVAGVLPPTLRIYMPPDSPVPTGIDVWGVM